MSSLDKLERLLLAATRRPWQVRMNRDQFGTTGYTLLQHTHGAIAVNKEDYFPAGYNPPTDEYGYHQPDEHMDCSEHLVANAELLAALSESVEELIRAARNNEVLMAERNQARDVVRQRDAEIERLRGILADTDRELRAAWNKRILPAIAISADLCQRIEAEVMGGDHG